MSLGHLHVLAATAVASEQGAAAAATTPLKAGATAWGANGDGCHSLAATFAMDVEEEPQSRPAARSSTDSHHRSGAAGVGKHHRHRAAEAKRRERINER